MNTSTENQQLPLTEQQNPQTRNLDTLSVAEVVQRMHQEDYAVLRAIEQAQPDIVATIERTAVSLKQGGRLIYIGAGTSGRLGILDAVECPPTFSAPPELVQALIAGGEAAVGKAVEGAEDSETGAIADLDRLGVGPLDMVVGIAASGTTPYVRAGLRHAKQQGAQTALIACNPIPRDDQAVDEFIVLPVGPEVLSGSTRLKSGTATKLVLNMISTVTMVQLGKVYDNLMVDMHISNQKLQKRAERIVCQLTGVSSEVATEVLARAQGEVKTALLMQLRGLEPEAARAALAAAQGHLRQALAGA